MEVSEEDYKKIQESKGNCFFFHNKLISILDELDIYRKNIVFVAPNIMTIDFFCKAILDSACNVDVGFKQMIDSKNYLCAIPMIRTQLDNAMVALAGLMADNFDDFFDGYAEGVPLNNMRDINGNLFSSRKLSKALDTILEGSKDLYDKTCSYVHSSSSALKASWYGDKKGMMIVKGWEDAKPYNYSEEDIQGDYFRACLALFLVLEKWVVVKAENAEIYRKIEKGEPVDMSGYELKTEEEQTKHLMRMEKILLQN